ncbi:AraC family transcriptional regulator [Spirosoma flavum]|uniref:Helix-turn-helix domain-containing protein n=1 Tax=Spirosoma flavum TaxID=2048557 RepID=A0ABW6ATE4_9BACT
MYIYSLCVGITLTNLVMIAFLLLILQENRNRVANRLLALFCLNYASIDAYELIVSKNIYDAYPILIETDTLLLLPFGPLVYLYVQAMTQVRFKLQSRQLIHLLPILVYGLWLLPFKLQPMATQIAQFHHWLSDRRTAPLMTIYYSKGIIIGYLISAYWLVHRHQRIVRQVLAALDQNTLQWVKGLIWSLMILYSIWVLNNESWLPNRLYFGLAQVGFSYWLAYFVMNQKAIYTHVTPTISLVSLDQPPSIRYRNSGLTSADVRTLSERVSQFMRSEKPFLDKDLTLTTLADQLSLSPTSLSQVLNEGVGANFYSFVNRHRIEESKHLLVDPTLAHYSILGIAFEAGFNSKSTFNKTFREFTGQSPSDYQKAHRSRLP